MGLLRTYRIECCVVYGVSDPVDSMVLAFDAIARSIDWEYHCLLLVAVAVEVQVLEALV